MAIDPERIASMPKSVLVSEPLKERRLRWNGIFPSIEDNRPPASRTVEAEHLSNRRYVKCGRVIAWGEHGRVAVVRDENGTEAAFWHFELIESPKTKAMWDKEQENANRSV